jgi:hypothetical protein
MSYEKVPCSNCGKLIDKDSTYCIHCGAKLNLGAQTPTDLPHKPVQTITTVTPSKKKHKFPYHTLIFFSVVLIIDLIVSFSVMNGFQLPVATFGQLYLIFFLVIGFSIGLLWVSIAEGGFSGGDFEGCAYVIGAIIVIAIGAPLILMGILSTVATSIGNAISEGIENAFSEMFADVEIPGFEPFLFFGLLAVLSILMFIRYNKKTKNS